ncbi:AraC family transcriptional regulator, partial [Methylobacterium frigidaeris]
MARTDVRNATRFWADPAYPALSFIEADFTTHGYANHAHGVYVFATTESGSSQFSARGTTDYARGDALLAFAPGQPHATCMGSSGRWAYRGLYVATRRMVELAGVFGHRHVP